MSDILITGFEPFLQNKENPSQLLGAELAKFSGADFICLPVSYDHSWEVLHSQLCRHSYESVLMLGLASERTRISLERVAINWQESSSPDNDGKTKVGEKIDPSFPEAFISHLDLSTWAHEIQKELQVPVEVSFSAGAYLCNHVYFRTLAHFPKAKSLFVHLPKLEVLNFEKQLKVLVFIQKSMQSLRGN